MQIYVNGKPLSPWKYEVNPETKTVTIRWSKWERFKMRLAKLMGKPTQIICYYEMKEPAPKANVRTVVGLDGQEFKVLLPPE